MSIFTRFLSKPSSDPLIQEILDHLYHSKLAVDTAWQNIAMLEMDLRTTLSKTPVEELSGKMVDIWFSSSRKFDESISTATERLARALTVLSELKSLPLPDGRINLSDKSKIVHKSNELVNSLTRLQASFTSYLNLIRLQFRPAPDEVTQINETLLSSHRILSTAKEDLIRINDKVKIPTAISNLSKIQFPESL